MYVKICGLRDAGTAAWAARCGADAVGVVMSPGSPRDARPDEAVAVIRAAKAVAPAIDAVLVVSSMPAAEAAAAAQELGFDVLQLHGGYGRADFAAAGAVIPRLWRATSLAEHPGLRAGDLGEERLLVDGARAGSGEPWDLALLGSAELGAEWILAGGLHPGNVSAAVAQARPWGVDVSSGVERSRGLKDHGLIERFIRAAGNRPATES